MGADPGRPASVDHQPLAPVADLASLERDTKKKTLVATEQQRAAVQVEREQFRAILATYRAQDLVFLDETGVTTTMTRRYGWAPRGQRVIDYVPHGHWKGLTVLGALTSDGILAAMTVDAATDSDVFRAYVTEVLVPALRPGQIVILDNLSAHKAAGVGEAIEAASCHLLYLPPYSPDLNPIEPGWSKWKEYLRAEKVRQLEALTDTVGTGLRRITAQDARGYWRDCGYPLQ